MNDSTSESTVVSQTNAVLPNLCSVEALLSLVIFGQLLAIVLVIAKMGVEDFSWPIFGLTTFLIEWVILCSVACVCPLRHWLSKQGTLLSVSCCYGIVLSVTALCSIAGQYLLKTQTAHIPAILLSHLFIAAIILGIFLHYFYLRQRLMNQEQTVLEAKIQALQSRIRPHFLFNSMNSIASLIAIDASKAEQMVVDLAELFRASLKEPSFVPLFNELSLCKRFLAIEQQRLGDRLSVKWQLSDSTLLNKANIPSLILQPLLENAIYHGVQPLEKGGEILVEVEHTKDEILIKITNPRLPGAETAQHTRHRKQAFQKRLLEGNGIAMDNIRHRLKALYGPKASLRLVQSETEFTVIVRFPFRTDAALAG